MDVFVWGGGGGGGLHGVLQLQTVLLSTNFLMFSDFELREYENLTCDF